MSEYLMGGPQDRHGKTHYHEPTDPKIQSMLDRLCKKDKDIELMAKGFDHIGNLESQLSQAKEEIESLKDSIREGKGGLVVSLDKTCTMDMVEMIRKDLKDAKVLIEKMGEALKELIENCEWYAEDPHDREGPHMLYGFKLSKEILTAYKAWKEKQ